MKRTMKLLIAAAATSAMCVPLADGSSPTGKSDDEVRTQQVQALVEPGGQISAFDDCRPANMPIVCLTS